MTRQLSPIHRKCVRPLRLLLLLILALVISTCSSLATSSLPTESPAAQPTNFTPTQIPLPSSLESSRAHNVILMIGDGMGAVHRQAATWFAQGREGKLVMDRLPIHGTMITLNAYGQVTDSAAAATAFATGVKTANQRISIDPSGVSQITILEQAQGMGMAVGLVTTTEIANATPAAFAAHVPNRGAMADISLQLIEAGVDILFGGGEKYLLPESQSGCFSNAGSRVDGQNLIELAIQAGYSYTCDGEELAGLEIGTRRILGIFAEEGMERPFQPSLVQMTIAAIEHLSQDPDGFFLMVEGGQIDWASHGWDAENAIGDTLEFDQAVQIAREFAETNGETLLIVTADHETGGMKIEELPEGLSGGRSEFEMPDGSAFKVRWSTSGHTDSAVPVTAMGPGSELLVGTINNTLINQVMRLALWIGKPFPEN